VAAKVGGCSEDCKFCAQSEHYHTAGGQSKLTDQQVLDSATHAADVGAEQLWHRQQRPRADAGGTGRLAQADHDQDWPPKEKPGPAPRSARPRPRPRSFSMTAASDESTTIWKPPSGIIPISSAPIPYSERINTLRIAKEAGLSLCSGGIFGMGEEWRDRLDMLLTLREIGVDVVPLNFLNAIHGTPLENQPELHPMECLKIISIARFLMPGKEIKVAGGREKVLRDVQSWIFLRRRRQHDDRKLSHNVRRTPETDHQMVRDLGLRWKAYFGGGVEAKGDPTLGNVAHTGKHRIPILYEREVKVEA